MVQKISTLISFIVLIAASYFVVGYQQDIKDWWYLRQYTPSSEVVELATNAHMSQEGRNIFYLGDPVVDDAETFSTHCQQREKSYVLGCYAANKIYIFNVIEPKLNGVKEVTAAHEMLHAAYQRLDVPEQTRLNTLLDAQLKRVKNTRILDLIELYQTQDNGRPQYNEMHSIFGTEIMDLDPQLLKHYKQYFEDREALVRIAENYESVFTALREESDALLNDITDLKTLIDELNLTLTTLKTKIDAHEQRLSALKNDVESARAQNDAAAESAAIAEYNALVAEVQGSIREYNQFVAELNASVSQHNSKVKLYNATVGEQNKLVESLDSTREAL